MNYTYSLCCSSEVAIPINFQKTLPIPSYFLIQYALRFTCNAEWNYGVCLLRSNKTGCFRYLCLCYHSTHSCNFIRPIVRVYELNILDSTRLGLSQGQFRCFGHTFALVLLLAKLRPVILVKTYENCLLTIR